ncbi:MAG: AsmA family protein, partial [Deltaproteobacteria bacterium]|nr:AsmA family protein [Deltaproteobacteria bacterium]
MRWKWILGILAALILAVVITVYIVLSSYDFNSLKPTITKEVRDATGRELTLGGDIALKIGLIPSLVVEDVRFQNATWGSRPDLAKIKRFELQVALLPLITGDIRIRRLVAIEPDILIETDKSGKSNLEFTPDRETTETPTSKDEIPLPIIFFKEIRIEKGRITYNDGPAQRSYEVELNSFTAKSKDDPDGMEVTLNGTYRGMPFEIDGTTGFMDAVADPQKAWPLKLSLKAGGARITVNGTIKDVLNGKGLDLTMTAEGPSIPRLAKLADVTGLPDVGPFKATTKVADPEGKLTLPHLDIQLGTPNVAKLNVKGSIAHPMTPKGIDVNFEVQGKDLANLEKFTGSPLPVKGPFRFSGRARDISHKKFEISDLKSTLGESVLKGSVVLNLARKRPLIDVVLTSEKLDLRPLLIQKRKTKGPGKKPSRQGAKNEKVFPDDPLPLEALNQIDASVKAHAKMLLLPGLAFEDMNMDMVLEKGNLSIKPFNARMGGGKIDARVHLNAGRKVPRATLFLKGTQLDLGRMMKDLGQGEILEGKLDLDIDLKGKGRTPATIMAVLNGKTSLVMGDGKIDNAYIETFGADISSSMFRLLNPAKAKAEYTRINCFVGLFDIKDGIAVTSALV